MIWTHLTELAIDRLLANELSRADQAAMWDHAATCADCGRRLDDAYGVQRTFALEPPLRLPKPVRRPWVSPWMGLGGALALAAGLAVALTWPRASADAEGVRTKGTSIVGYFISHGDHVRRGGVRDAVMPGDRIELVTTTVAPLWFAAISDDTAGVRSVYIEPRHVEPGREQLLPTAIELDATLGSEQVTGVFCAAPFDPRAIDIAAPPPGCTLDRFTLVKVPR